MEGYVVSIHNNLLKVTLLGTAMSAEKEVASNLDVHEVLAEELGELILESFGPKPQKLPFIFLVEPHDAHLSFLTVSKGNNDDAQLLDLAKSKLGTQGLALENFYFSYQKIAPFVYQFVAIEKEKMEKYLQVATDLGFELSAVIPWALLLPKHLSESGDPSIFVLNDGEHKYLILSELGGIYHLDLLDKTKSAGDLEKLIQKLSVYQRNTPITNIYALNMEELDLGDKYKVKNLDISDSHTLVEKEVDLALLDSQLNLLTLLPLPEVAKKPSPMVYVGAVLAALTLVGGFFGVRALRNNNASDSNLASNSNDLPVVLSEVKESSETTSSDGSFMDTSSDEGTEVSDLNRGYLRIRVENGTLIGGLAGKTRNSLDELGYDIVSIGDSDSDDTVVTSVKFNPENILYKDLLEADLNSIFGATDVTSDLAPGLDYDVLIIAGSDDGSEE